jgi:hypothetical protein
MSVEASRLQSEQAEIIYAREPGENKVVHLREWNHDAPFGHCPACGSLGMEDAPCRESEEILFQCSDMSCLTCDSEGVEDTSGLVAGVNRTYPTSWSDKKPRDLRQQESQGISWNTSHFSLEFCEEHDLV